MKNLFILLLTISFKLYAQKEDYTWIAGISPVKMVFNDTDFTYDNNFQQVGGLQFFITSFTQNDSAGNLLYYTNGAEVYDRNGNLMQVTGLGSLMPLIMIFSR